MNLLDRISGYLTEEKKTLPTKKFTDWKEWNEYVKECGYNTIIKRDNGVYQARMNVGTNVFGQWNGHDGWVEIPRNLQESLKTIFPKGKFKTDKEVTNWISLLDPKTVVDMDVVGPQSGKVLLKKGTKITRKPTTGNDKTIHESEDFPKIKTKADWLAKCKEYGYKVSNDGDDAPGDMTAYNGKNIKVGQWEASEYNTPRGWIEVPVKRKEIHEEVEILLEDRRADLNYKEKLVKHQLDRVIVELEAHESGAMTKMASRYFSIDKAVKKLMEVKDKMNAGVKERAEALFNAEDIVLTRVVETVSFTLTLSKQMQIEASERTVVNYELIAKELMKLISDELKPQVDAIVKEATTKTAIPASTKSPALRIQPKVEEGFIDSTVDMFKNFVIRFKNWAKMYDRKLTELKRKL